MAVSGIPWRAKIAFRWLITSCVLTFEVLRFHSSEKSNLLQVQTLGLSSRINQWQLSAMGVPAVSKESLVQLD